MQLRGGEGTFPALSIGDNLRAALLGKEMEPEEDRDEGLPRRSRPSLRSTADSENLRAICREANNRCWPWPWRLSTNLKFFSIDELSLGLAPVVVQELLEVVQDLKAQGQTMIIVEQSLNVALAFSDRAVFMEKGVVRFEGSAQELAERDDLARAVFLGGEGG